jgi:shikimate dehydrogenase
MLPENSFYAILGKNPSKTARSPKLWNAAFKKLNKKEKMIPIDVKNNLIFKQYFKKLELNRFFKGGAITNPYKEVAYRLLGKHVDKESKKARAVNCLYRGSKGKLYGTNTDGIAALEVLKKNLKNLKNKKILLIGFGGAGKAIASAIDNFSKNILFISSRSKKKQRDIVKKFKYRALSWNSLKDKIYLFDALINCTSVGHNNRRKNPLTGDMLKNINNKLVFDIIYSPPETKLLSIAKKNNKVVNGLEMNLLQALIAFLKATNLKHKSIIYHAMKSVK